MKKMFFTCFLLFVSLVSFGKPNFPNPLDSIFRQREITILTETFSENIELLESVIIRIQKAHQNGYISADEIIINQENYKQNEPYISLKYDWKGDEKSAKWLEYEYEVTWYLVDGQVIHLPTKKSREFSINLIFPWWKTQIEIETDTELLKKNGINLIIMHLYYKVGEKEFSKQVVFNANKTLQKVDVFVSQMKDSYYEYDINWFLTNNKMISSGRKKGTDPYMFVGELPKN